MFEPPLKNWMDFWRCFTAHIYVRNGEVKVVAIGASSVCG